MAGTLSNHDAGGRGGAISTLIYVLFYAWIATGVMKEYINDAAYCENIYEAYETASNSSNWSVNVDYRSLMIGWEKPCMTFLRMLTKIFVENG